MSSAADKREAIFASALQAFTERGYHGAAVPDIARRAGVGAGTIYRYFENKESLANELFRHWKNRMASAVMDHFPYDAAPREQFHQYWQRTLHFAREFPRAQAFLELHHHADYLDDQSLALELRLFETARAMIAVMQERQAIRSGAPDLLMAVVYGNVLGLVKAAWHGHITLNDAAINFGERCCWEAIRA